MYMITEKEYAALEIAGFSSVSELLARYFALLKNTGANKPLFPKNMPQLDVIGSNACQINLEK